MADNSIHKIIYFDKETIRNILQEQNKGEKKQILDSSTSYQKKSDIETGGTIKLNTPFLARLGFLFSSKMNQKYIVKKEETTTISSTEISEFEELKPRLKKIPNVELKDIDKSATFFRAAGGFLRIVKGGVEGVDIKEFNSVMDSYNGYDTYKIDDTTYVRFNRSSFVSNYKRNDILTMTMTLYCVSIGKTDKDRFDFLKELEKMEALGTGMPNATTLYEMYPPASASEQHNTKTAKASSVINLYDVIYACTESIEVK